MKALADDEYVALLNLFTNAAEVAELFDKFNANNLFEAGKAGREFFEAKYGVPDGHEVDRMVELRQWPRVDGNPFLNL